MKRTLTRRHFLKVAGDESYAMFGRNGGSGTKLYDLAADPAMDTDLAGERPDMVEQMFEGYVLKDAGGPLPTY